MTGQVECTRVVKWSAISHSAAVGEEVRAMPLCCPEYRAHQRLYLVRIDANVYGGSMANRIASMRIIARDYG